MVLLSELKDTNSILAKYKNRYIYFYILALVLIPIDSFPFLPISSINRPLSVIPLFVYFLYDKIWHKNIHRIDIALISIFLLSNVWALISALFIHNDFSAQNKFFITSVISFVMIASTISFFKQLSRYRMSEQLRIIYAALIYSSFLPVIIGFLQLLAIFHIVSWDYISPVTQLFSYRVTIGRIQGVSGEPSWASRYFLTLLFMFSLVYFKNRKFKVLFISIIGLLFVFTGSALGYLSLLLSLCVFLFLGILLDLKKLLKAIKISLVICVTLLILGTVYSSILDQYTVNRIDSLIKIFSSFDEEELYSAAKLSGSVFQRVFNPIIGLTIPFRGYPFGVGPESYHYLYPTIIRESYPWAANHAEIADVIAGKRIITSKMLYAKVISEFGVAGFLLIVFLFLKIMYLIIRIPKRKDRDKMLMLFSFTLILVVNTDSYLYFPFIFLLCMVFFHSVSLINKIEEDYQIE